jgi:hypothetical protein
MPERNTPLARWLYQQDMTQAELARKLQLDQATISRAAKDGIITAGLWYAFCDAYGKTETYGIFGPLQVGRNKPPAEDKP